MSNFKETLKKRWWVALIIVLVIIEILPSSNSSTKHRTSSSTSGDVTYYKWPCKYCGRKILIDQVLSPNKEPYTADNGYAFCSKDCWYAFRSLGN